MFPLSSLHFKLSSFELLGLVMLGLVSLVLVSFDLLHLMRLAVMDSVRMNNHSTMRRITGSS